MFQISQIVIWEKRCYIRNWSFAIAQNFWKTLHLVPMRLQKMLLKVQPYTFKLMGKPGKEMYIADTLSRAHPQSVIHIRDDIDEFLVTAADVKSMSVFSSSKQKDLKEATLRDNALQKMSETIRWMMRSKHSGISKMSCLSMMILSFEVNGWWYQNQCKNSW